MFKFDFKLDDDIDNDKATLSNDPFEQRSTNLALDPFTEHQLWQLLDALPPLISYSPLSVPLLQDECPLTLVRRDLFDARFQLISEGAGDDDPGEDHSQSGTKHSAHSSALEFLDNPSDLVPGVYEGGLKTWECSLDLVGYLDSIRDGAAFFTGNRVLEIGCGTAIPSLYILRELFTVSANGSKESQIHLQDYNASVLELVTLPNLVLAWYMSPASTPYRKVESHPESPQHLDPTIPSELAITPELKDAFVASLKAHNITLRFFSGSWDTFNVEQTGGPYDIVLTSETIYRTESIPSLIDLMEAACRRVDNSLEGKTSQLSIDSTDGDVSFSGTGSFTRDISMSGSMTMSGPVSISGSVSVFDNKSIGNTVSKSGDYSQSGEISVSEESHSISRDTDITSDPKCLCLVAAKLLYFGVGGGISQFTESIERPVDRLRRGRVENVWERKEGVRRKILRLRWEE